MAGLSRSIVRGLWPDSLFGRLALLLVAVALISHVLALSLMFELRPVLPPMGAPMVPPGPPPGGPHGPPWHGMLLDIGVRLGAVVLAAWVGARWLSAPLRRLAASTQALALDIRGASVSLDGPTECREAGEGINQLQKSILTQMEERDRFVAAVSHDLRTPLTRLALRVESLPDAAERERFGRDIRAMETMIRDTLGYLHGELTEEAWVMLDLASLLHSAADDRQDCGQPVSWTPPEGAVEVRAQVQLSALRRALDNLIDNALFYGNVADLGLYVTTTGGRSEVHLMVADRGPGIPADARTRVLQPFVRLEASRNRHTGGTGLGLAVVHDVARRHGGRVELHDRQGGGLQAELILPITPGPQPQT